MALTLTKIALVDPTQTQRDFVGTPLDSTVYSVDLTLGATSDYSSGIDLTSSVLLGATGIGCTQVIGVLNAAVRTSGGTARNLTPQFNQGTQKLQFVRGNGTLFANAVQRVGSAGTQTAPLSGNAFTLPANTLSANGQGIRFRAWGTKTTAGEAGTITLTVNSTIATPPVGGTAVLTMITTANAQAQHWVAQLEWIRTGAATQQLVAWGQASRSGVQAETDSTLGTLFTAGSFDHTTAIPILPTVNSTTGTTCTIEGQYCEVFGPTGAGGNEIVPATDLAAGDIVRMTVVCI